MKNTPRSKKGLIVFAVFFVVLGLAFSSQHPALAAGVSDVKGGLDKIAGDTGLAVGGSQDPLDIIGGVVKTLLGFLGAAFLLLIIYAGIKWMFSMGEEKKITSARKIITSASVGIAVIILSYAIVTFVLNILSEGTGGGGGGNGGVPICPNSGVPCNPSVPNSCNSSLCTCSPPSNFCQ